MEPATNLVLGVDIGGTNTAFGLVDRAGRCAAQDSMPTEGARPAAAFFRRLHDRGAALLEGLGPGHALAGIGIAAPNGNFFTGTIENPPNLSWSFVDVAAEVARHDRVPVATTNDANAVAIGEMLFGAARGMRDFIAITLGTGLGSGIVVNGELVYGADGLAGELGHLPATTRSGRECGCGKLGCLETYASATGITRTALELMAIRRGPSALRAVAPARLDSRLIGEAAAAGDALALEAFDRTGRILGARLADMVMLNRPEAIILFGGLAAAGELIFAPTRRALAEGLPPGYRGQVALLPSGLPGNAAAILGAGAVIWQMLERRAGA